MVRAQGSQMKFIEAVDLRKDLIAAIGRDNTHLAMAIALFIEEPDVPALASEGLTDGGNDKKIDFIYHDVENRRLVFAQGFFSISAKKADTAPANKASDLNTACAWLISGDLSTVPPKLAGIIAEFREALANGDIDFIDLLYIHNLAESVAVSRELQTVEGHLRTAIANDKILVKSHELGEAKLDSLLAAQDSHIEVLDQIAFPGTIGIRQSGKTWRSGVASVDGAWVHELYERYGDKLYSANYRGFLGADGRKRVNSGIRQTAENAPDDFWAYNNGITILTSGWSEDKKAGTTLRGISVINGAQTTGSVGMVDKNKARLSELSLLCRIIECSDQETVDRIVRYNNTQNAITTWDQFSNDDEQRRIEDEFKELGFAYNRKRGFSAVGDQIGIEQVLQPLLAYHGRSQDAVRGKNQLFTNKPLYKNAFEGKKARHILFAYALSRAIDAKRLELKRKSDEGTLIAIEQKQLQLLRNLNFKPFLVNVIANSLEAIVGKVCDPLTVGFKPIQAKDHTINELAARWLPVVETFLPLMTAVIEPDTFFRQHSSGEDSFIQSVKAQMDAMLVASGAAAKHADFADMVAC